MKTRTRYTNSLIVLATVMALTPAVYAAYPKKMDVTVEVWNNMGEELSLTAASWLAPDTDLSPYVMPADYANASFSITLDNARNDSATFRLHSKGKECEFKIAHAAKFQWLSINPAPEKSARAKSVGQVPAKCTASVIKGTDSLSAYSVIVGMKHITR